MLQASRLQILLIYQSRYYCLIWCCSQSVWWVKVVGFWIEYELLQWIRYWARLGPNPAPCYFMILNFFLQHWFRIKWRFCGWKRQLERANNSGPEQREDNLNKRNFYPSPPNQWTDNKVWQKRSLSCVNSSVHLPLKQNYFCYLNFFFSLAFKAVEYVVKIFSDCDLLLGCCLDLFVFKRWGAGIRLSQKLVEDYWFMLHNQAAASLTQQLEY